MSKYIGLLLMKNVDFSYNIMRQKKCFLLQILSNSITKVRDFAVVFKYRSSGVAYMKVITLPLPYKSMSSTKFFLPTYIDNGLIGVLYLTSEYVRFVDFTHSV